MVKVTVIKTSPETVIEDYSMLLDSAEYKKYLPIGKDIILKLNLSWTKFFPACSTQPWQLDGVLNKLKKDGHKKIYPVENNTVVTDVKKGVVKNKWINILKKNKLKLQPLTEVEWVDYKIKNELLAIPKIFPNGLKIPKMFIGKNVLHLPTIKTHGHTVTTGAMKNAFGGLITKRRHHCHKMIHEVLVDLLQIQKEIHPGIFAVMDGAVAGDGAGPRTMIPREKNYILASNDQVAIDAISAKMMGFSPLKIKYIKLAHDKGLGCGDVKDIDIVGEDVNNVNFKFQTEKSPVIFFDQLFRKRLKSIEKILFHTSLFHFCVMGSNYYHDHLWYNTVGRKRINKFMKTEWGQLFKQY
jgi:uncharacterized protein (DUF362 family)